MNMELIEADDQSATIKISRRDLGLLMSCAIGVSYDFEEIEDVHLLGVTREDISQLRDRMYNLTKKYYSSLDNGENINIQEDEK